LPWLNEFAPTGVVEFLIGNTGSLLWIDKGRYRRYCRKQK